MSSNIAADRPFDQRLLQYFTLGIHCNAFVQVESVELSEQQDCMQIPYKAEVNFVSTN